MVINQRNQVRPTVLSEIYSHPDINFYLTGSRFFNHARENSDWDFFVLNSPKVSDFINAHDFHPDDIGSYEDVQGAMVWHNEEENIHLQVLNRMEDIFLKTEAQKFLLDLNILQYLNKGQAKILWRSVIDNLRLGRFHV